MTTKQGEPSPEVAQLLAEAHAARLVAREVQLAPNAASPGVHELWAYVRREPGAPASLAIERAIRTGVARDGHKLFPPMPFAAYQNLADDDMAALIAYLRSLPAVE